MGLGSGLWVQGKQPSKNNAVPALDSCTAENTRATPQDPSV